MGRSAVREDFYRQLSIEIARPQADGLIFQGAGGAGGELDLVFGAGFFGVLFEG